MRGIGKKTKTKNKRIKSNPNNKQFTLAVKVKDELSYLSSNCHQVGTKGQWIALMKADGDVDVVSRVHGSSTFINIR